MSERLPTGWKQDRLDVVAELERTTVEPQEIREGTKYVGLEHIESSGEFTAVPEVDEGELASNKFAFSKQHVLYGKLRPYLTKIARPDFSGVCSTEIIPIRTNGKLNRDYLFYYLRQPRIVALANTRTAGANLPRLSPTDLASFPICYPESPNEQRRIAGILDEADALRRKRAEAIRLANDLVPSLFYEMFGDVRTNPLGWTTEPVSEFTEEFEGGKNLLADDESATEATYRILKVSAVTWREYDPTESKPLPPDYVPPANHFVRQGDLLFSRANTTELVGATAYVFNTPENRILPDKIWRFVWREPRRVDPLYVWSLFQDPYVRFQIGQRATGTSGSMKNISMPKVMTLPVPVPPLGLQEEFAEQVRIHRAMLERQMASRTELDNLFHSLLQRAFRGEL